MAARRRGLGDITRAVRDTAGYLGLPLGSDPSQQASLVEVALGASEMKDAAAELRTGGLRRRSVQVRLAGSFSRICCVLLVQPHSYLFFCPLRTQRARFDR